MHDDCIMQTLSQLQKTVDEVRKDLIEIRTDIYEIIKGGNIHQRRDDNKNGGG